MSILSSLLSESRTAVDASMAWIFSLSNKLGTSNRVELALYGIHRSEEASVSSSDIPSDRMLVTHHSCLSPQRGRSPVVANGRSSKTSTFAKNSVASV